jgi:hypothetical protein
MTREGLVAMIPCEIYTAHIKKKWTKMPFQAILDDLTARKIGVLQADQKSKSEKLPKGMDPDQKAAFLANVVEGPNTMSALDETPRADGTDEDPKDKGVQVTRPLWYEYTIRYGS